MAIALALAGAPASGRAAEQPFETLRLNRLGTTDPAAEFSVPTPDGSSIELSALRSKVVLLSLWATWCEPCLEEMTAMERLERAYRERGLAVLAVSVDREGASIVSAIPEAPRAELPRGARSPAGGGATLPALGPAVDHRPEPEGHPALLGPGRS